MTTGNYTAAKLADMLDAMVLTPPDTFGLPAAMSMLCEETLAFGPRSTAVDKAVRAFDVARLDFKGSTTRGGYSPPLWSKAIETAGTLAGALRVLGEFGATRCGVEREWGRCKVAVDDASPCPYHRQVAAKDASP